MTWARDEELFKGKIYWRVTCDRCRRRVTFLAKEDALTKSLQKRMLRQGWARFGSSDHCKSCVEGAKIEADQ